MTDVIASERLQQLVDKIESLDAEKSEIAEQIKEVMGEAKSEGFDIKALRQVLRLRKMARHDRELMEQLMELYKSALGME
jgi:uncharacterized protein (UPF0335 family)